MASDTFGRRDPFAFHFDFVNSSGEVLMTSEGAGPLITLPGGRLDGRVAAAMAVALDALPRPDSHTRTARRTHAATLMAA
jgi:hypothetical protein